MVAAWQQLEKEREELFQQEMERRKRKGASLGTGPAPISKVAKSVKGAAARSARKVSLYMMCIICIYPHKNE